MVKNVVIPSTSNIYIVGIGATIQAISGGDSDYLVASYKYVNNNAQADIPIRVEGITFDGAGITTNAFVCQNWNTTFRRCTFQNANNGLKVTAQTQNGTAFSSSTLVNNRYENCTFQSNTGHGLYIVDPSRNKVTDYFIIDCFSHGNGGWGFNLQSTAGALIDGNHLYGNTSGDIFVSIGSLGSRFTHNYCEDNPSLQFGDFNAVSVVVSGNVFRGQVYPYGTNPGLLHSIGNIYQGTNGYIYQNYGAVNVYSTGDTFDSSNPYQLHSGAPNKFYVKNSVSLGLGSGVILDGIQQLGSLTRKVSYGTSPPSSGTYAVDDIVYNINPTVQGTSGSQYVVLGWICISAGTPGTWVPMQVLTGT